MALLAARPMFFSVVPGLLRATTRSHKLKACMSQEAARGFDVGGQRNCVSELALKSAKGEDGA